MRFFFHRKQKMKQFAGTTFNQIITEHRNRLTINQAIKDEPQAILSLQPDSRSSEMGQLSSNIWNTRAPKEKKAKHLF